MHLISLEEYSYDQLFLLDSTTANSNSVAYGSTVLQVDISADQQWLAFLMESQAQIDFNYETDAIVFYVVCTDYSSNEAESRILNGNSSMFCTLVELLIKTNGQVPTGPNHY